MESLSGIEEPTIIMIFVGTVIAGKQQGRTLGYPTANVEYVAELVPEVGVWACFVRGGQMETPLTPLIRGEYKGLAVVGMWQQSNNLPSLEVHLLDFDGDLYGQILEVKLMNKIRDLQKFDSRDELVTQIKKDIILARERFFIKDSLSRSE